MSNALDSCDVVFSSYDQLSIKCTTSVILRHFQRLKAALHYGVGRTCQTLEVQIKFHLATREVIAVITDTESIKTGISKT